MEPLDCRPKLIGEMMRRFKCSLSVAEDAVDEAIARSLRVEIRAKNIFPLLYQIAKNVMLDRLKRAAIATRNTKIINPPSVTSETPLHRSMAGELATALELALLGLSERDREAFKAYYLEGVSYKEVALKMGVTENHARAIAFRARHRLQARLARFAS